MARPAFLPAGWPSLTGWRLPAVRPPVEDPAWDAFLHIITAAQHGDFSHGDDLVALALQDHSECDYLAELVGAIASHADLRRLFPLIGSDRSFFVSCVANESHWLDFAEACLANRFDSELRPLFFSEFLEEWDDDALESGGPYAGYLDRVRAKITAVRAAYPGIAHVHHGAPLHPRAFIAALERYAGEPDDPEFQMASSSIAKALLRIEMFTGVRLPQVVFENEAFGRVVADEEIPGSPLRRIRFDPEGLQWAERGALTAALAILGEEDLDRFALGRRYFYGHVVPD